MTDFYHSVIKFLEDGGIFIFPIGIVLFFGLSIGLERWVFLTLEKLRNKKALGQLVPILSSAKKQQMLDYASQSNASIARIIGFGLKMMASTKDREDIENALSEGMLDVVAKLNRRTNYTAMLANVATLLGLLGTIIGLIGAFTAVASADPIEKSRILSESISVAMNTTAFGIIVAIPLLVIHALLTNKTQAITNDIEAGSIKFLNIMTKLRLIETRSPNAALTSQVANAQQITTQVSQTIKNKKTSSNALNNPPKNILVENELSLDDEPTAAENTSSLSEYHTEENIPNTPVAPAPIETPPVPSIETTSTPEVSHASSYTDEPVKAQVTEVQPIEPEITERLSIKPEPVKPKPVEPEQALEPEPIKPKPVKPKPVEPEQALEPEPVKPEPVKPEPVKPEPVKPEPVKPEPVKPETIEPHNKEELTEPLQSSTDKKPLNEQPIHDDTDIEEKKAVGGKAVFNFSEPTNLSLEEELKLLELKKHEIQQKIEDEKKKEEENK